MELTEQQRTIAIRVAEDLSSVDSSYELRVIERFLAALPKPEPVGKVVTWNPCEGLVTFQQTHKTNGYPDPRIGSPIYTAPPIEQDLLTIHRILQCVADCPPVEPGDSKVMRDFKSYCITMNGIAERLRAKHASEQKPVALPFAIFDQELADLRRFHELAMDGEGYDVPKERMKRLAEIGLLRRVSANYYEHTTFGLSVINGDFDTTPPATPDKVAALVEALSNVAQSLAWNCFGECRSYPTSTKLLTPREADDAAKAALAAVKEQ